MFDSIQTTDLSLFALKQQIKEELQKNFFTIHEDANCQTFKEYSYTLRFTKLYKGCIYNYGSQSQNFMKLSFINQNSLPDYVKTIIPLFEKIAEDPHSFLFNYSFKAKSVENIDRKYKEILDKNYAMRSKEDSEKKIDNIIFQLLRDNLLKFASLYTSQNVKKIRQRYNKLAKQIPFDELLKNMNISYRMQWEDIVVQCLNINILQQIISDMKQTHKKFIEIFQIICKPIANKYCDVLAERMVWWASEHPKFDKQKLHRRDSSNKQDNKLNFLQKKQSKIQSECEDDSIKRGVINRLKDVDRYSDNNEKALQYKYFKDLVKRRIQKQKNTITSKINYKK